MFAIGQNTFFVFQNVQAKEIERDGQSRREKFQTLPMGIEESFLETGKNRREGELNDQEPSILSNRNLFPLYNVSLLIRAIPIVLQEEPNTKFFIAGDGPEKENLEREVENLKVSPSVKFLGRVPHEEMADLLGPSRYLCFNLTP